MASMNVKRYADGETVGAVDLPADEADQYAAGEHPAYQWPEGISEAGDVLTAGQLAEMGLDARAVIWLE